MVCGPTLFSCSPPVRDVRRQPFKDVPIAKTTTYHRNVVTISHQLFCCEMSTKASATKHQYLSSTQRTTRTTIVDTVAEGFVSFGQE